MYHVFQRHVKIIPAVSNAIGMAVKRQLSPQKVAEDAARK
jgi:hypothetical protein